MALAHAPVLFLLRGAAAAGHGRPAVSELATGALVTLVHLFTVLALRAAALDPVVPAPPPETVTYLDVPPPAAASPRTPLRARQVIVSQDVRIPVAELPVEHPEKMAGFQVLLSPREVTGLPPAEPGGPVTVTEADFSGRGVVGGVAGGRPPLAVSAAVAESLAALGAADVISGPSRHIAREVRDADLVVEPRLINTAEVTQETLRRYPTSLRQAGIAGRAVVEFFVDSTGSVMPGSARVLSSTHDLFAEAALAVLSRARFTPGHAVFDGESLRMGFRVRLPLSWTIAY